MPHLPFAPDINPIFGWILASLAVLLLGIAKSGFGGGVGIVAVPMFALAFGAQRGTAILLPLLLATDIFSVYHHWGKWDKPLLKILAPGTLAGIALGSVILWIIVCGPIWPWHFDWSQWHSAAPTTQAKATQANSANALNLITGIVSILYIILDFIRLRLAPKWHFKPNQATGFVAGASVGVISTLAHAAGPVVTIFLLGTGLSRVGFMGTTVIYFFAINTVKLIPYTAIPGLTDWQTVQAGLWLIWLAPVGTWIGKWLCDRLSETLFRNIILIIVFISGAQLVFESLTGIKLVTLFSGHG